MRGSTLVERNKEYVQAARVIGVPSLRIMFSHVLPNVIGPILVGLNKSVQITQLGGKDTDIVNMAAIAAFNAE